MFKTDDFETIYYRIANSRGMHLTDNNIVYVDRFVTPSEADVIWSHLTDTEELFAATPSANNYIEKTYVFRKGVNLDEMVEDVDSFIREGGKVGIRLLVLPS